MSVIQQVKPRGFAWSYSRLKNYETCPRRYAETEIKKSTSETKNMELVRGQALHTAMLARVQGDAKLPPEFIYMEKWAERLTKLLHPFQIIQCELKLAVTKDGEPCGFFEKGVWLRGMIDYLRIIPTSTDESKGKGYDIGHVVDYKTGRPKDDWTQLMLNAYLIFQHYTHIGKLRTEFLWTEYSDTSHEDFKRADMQQAMDGMAPRIAKMEKAHVTNTFEPTPCGLCYEYCPVTQCEFHGKRYKREAA